MVDALRGLVDVIPSPDVGIAWVSRHRWRPGQALYANPADAPALWLMCSGSVDVTMAGQRWHIAAPCAFLAQAYVPRDIIAPAGAEWLSAGIRARLFGRIDLLQGLDTALLWQPAAEDRHLLEQWLVQLVDERERRDAAAALIAEGLARAIVGVCLRSLRGADQLDTTRWDLPNWLTTALRRMREQPRTNVQQLATLIGFSPAQFRRRFHEWVGQSPRAYVRAQRLATAQRLLETDMRVSEVARAAGFGTSAHFSRLFTQTFGVPPSSYRKAAKTAKV